VPHGESQAVGVALTDSDVRYGSLADIEDALRECPEEAWKRTSRPGWMGGHPLALPDYG